MVAQPLRTPRKQGLQELKANTAKCDRTKRQRRCHSRSRPTDRLVKHSSRSVHSWTEDVISTRSDELPPRIQKKSSQNERIGGKKRKNEKCLQQKK